MPPFLLDVTPGDPTPIYRQIARQVRLAVASGAVGRGEAMPSVRALAERLTVNPNTVARAYADLTREGVTTSRPGKGLFIAEAPAEPGGRVSAAERGRRLDAKADELVHAAVELGADLGEAVERLRRRFEALGVENNGKKS